MRAGFNNAIDTLNTINSGPSAPTTTEAYMLWADTTNNLLKQRNSSNTTWVVLGTLGAANSGLQPALHQPNCQLLLRCHYGSAGVPSFRAIVPLISRPLTRTPWHGCQPLMHPVPPQRRHGHHADSRR